MTDEELNARFTQLADAVTRVAETQSRFQEQVARGHVRFQEQLGDLAGFMRQMAERQDRHEQEIQALKQRQVESDERFNVLLQEIRFLIRQQQPPPASDQPQA